jgi:site-specific DNA recombinase
MRKELLQSLEQLYTKNEKVNNRHKAVIYTRVSTKEQAETNQSLETQKKYCEEYAQRNNLEVVSYFGGTYESAKSDERKEFSKMLQFVRRNKTIGYILCYSYDRFSRTGANASFLTEELQKEGIHLVAVTQKIDDGSASGSLTRDLLMILSRFENELRRDKTKTGMAELVKKGYWNWTPPRGYENKKKYHRAVDWEIAVNKEGELLRKAFRWRAANTYSSAEIVRRLQAEGMDINEKRLSEIFSNPFYCGLLKTKLLQGEIAQGRHEAIVSIEDFIKINSPESKSVSKVYETMTEELPLKRSLKCPSCGYNMSGFLVKKKGLYYYKCQKKCTGVNANAKEVHASFLQTLSQFQLPLASLEKYFARIMELKLTELNKTDRQYEKQLKEKLKDLQGKLESLEERHVLGEIDLSLFKKYGDKYKSEIEELEQKINSTSISSSNLQKCLANGLKLSKNISKIWVTGDLLDKHKLQHLLFPEGFSYDKKNQRVLTARVNSFFELIRSFSSELTKQKSGDSINFDEISARVTPEGF